MPKSRKSIALLLVLIMTVTNSLPAFAANVVTTNTVEIDTGQNTSGVTRFERESGTAIKPLSTKDLSEPQASTAVQNARRFNL